MHDALLRAASGAPLTEGEREQLRTLALVLADRSTLAPDTLVEDLPPAGAAESTVAGLRYVVRGPLGEGGMGEVLRVWDPVLRRTLALKVAHRALLAQPALLARFTEEARVQAGLQHPNLVPVHDLGVLEDGRPYFTMDEVQGEPMDRVIRRLHAASGEGWGATDDQWTLRRLVAAVALACRAVGHAHEHGIVHRDLKPQNLMVGSQGEVRVVDWGLAKREGPTCAEAEGVLPSARPRVTRAGSVAGTPAWMAPEQAAGVSDAVDARADVYALGAVLYTVLVGKAPYAEAPDAEAALARLRAGPPTPLREAARLPLPEDLVALVERAMARARDRRPADGHALARAIEDWLDGVRQHELAMARVREAEAHRQAAVERRRRAEALRQQARRVLDALPTWADEAEKEAGWALEDEASALEREAVGLEGRRGLALQAALTHAPELPEAHAAQAERWRERHAAAEAAGNEGEAATAEERLRVHVEALPPGHAARAPLARWLAGTATLDFRTDPPGAEVTLERFVTRRRRRVAIPVAELGPTPLDALPLAMGSYRLRVRAPGRAEVQVPVHLPRAGAWADVPPGATEPVAIPLPRDGELGPDEVYVPAGWFWAGGDPSAPGGLSRRRVWVDGFVIDRFPVTNTRYLAFLDDLVAQGREAEALRHAPRERAASAPGAMVYAFDGRRFSLRADADGDRWEPDWPVYQVDLDGASAFAAWTAARTGQPWRLPDELEWEKAARGVDGRVHPWGDAFDPSWCCMRDSHPGRPQPASVHRFPVDESVYGVRGLGGNLMDWTTTPFDRDGRTADGERVVPGAAEGDGFRILRGGSWFASYLGVRAATRGAADPGSRYGYLGFRLARSFP